MNLRQPHGSILINLIVITTIVAVLSAGMLYLTTTSTYASLFPTTRPRLLPGKAGVAHAQQLLAQNIHNPSFYPGGHRGIDPPVTYALANGDRFILTSYDFNNGGTPDPTRVVVEAIGVVHAGTWMESRRSDQERHPS